MDRGPSALSPEARIRALGTLSTGGTDELDVLVVGGGVVGAGVALDAVTRGLTTGLLEQRDLASGTSSRSSKLIHGGLRYLEMLDFGLVREALQERGLLLTRLAPHLVRPVPFLYPLTHRGWERPYVGSGLPARTTPWPGSAPPRWGCRGTGTCPARRWPGSPRTSRPSRSPARSATTTARSTTPGWCSRSPAPRPCTAPTSRPGSRSPASSARASGWSACAPSTWRTDVSSRSAPGWSSTPPACGPTRSRRWSAAAARCTCRRPRASTSSCRATGSAPRPASSSAPRRRSSS